MAFVRASRPPRKAPATAKPCPEVLRRDLSKTCSPDWRMGPDSRARNITQGQRPPRVSLAGAAQRLGPMGVGPRLSASYSASAAAAGQRLDALYLFAGLLINGSVAEVDVPVQARVRVVLVVILSKWMRWMRGRLS